jgi:hypothetical protein
MFGGGVWWTGLESDVPQKRHEQNTSPKDSIQLGLGDAAGDALSLRLSNFYSVRSDTRWDIMFPVPYRIVTGYQPRNSVGAVDKAMSATRFKIQRALHALGYLLLLQQQNGMGVANGRVPFKKETRSFSLCTHSLVSALSSVSVESWFWLVASVGELAPSARQKQCLWWTDDDKINVLDCVVWHVVTWSTFTVSRCVEKSAWTGLLLSRLQEGLRNMRKM